MKIKTRRLSIQPEQNKLKGLFMNSHFKRTAAGIIVGAVAGFAFFYFTEGLYMDSLPTKDILQSLAFGGLFGLFFTNSPCARNKC